MASNKSLNAKNLETLGVERLAELLIEISTGDAAAQRRLRMELAGARSPAELAKEVGKRLTSIARSRTFAHGPGVRALASDLSAQRKAIVETVAKADAAEGLDLLWRFMALAGPVFARCDDRNGAVIEVFHEACADLGEVAGRTRVAPAALADQVLAALFANDYGQFDGLISAVAAALGREGLDHLKRRLIDASAEPIERPADQDRVKIGWGASGPIYADDVETRFRARAIRMAMMEIADIEGDVEAFIAQYDEKTRKVPTIAAEIALRLLGVGRAEEALATLEAAARPDPAGWDWPDFDWEDARIDVLEALGRADDAQLARWACFERVLSTSHLRDFLKKLPDFDDVEAEERALDQAMGFHSPLEALSFLVSWPALERAARLVIDRAAELDGDHFEILSPAAEALGARHPLAASLILRSMIDFTLDKARSSRYRHAARHLMECTGLASGIPDFGKFETHEAYQTRLRRDHGRKPAFWSLMGLEDKPEGAAYVHGLRRP